MGKPVYTGNYSITFRIREDIEKEESDTESEDEEEEVEFDYSTVDSFIDVTIPILVYPKTILKYELLDTSGDTPVIVGPLPGVYPLPDKWDIQVQIKGVHDWWQMTLFGGGATGNNNPLTVSQGVQQSDLGTYRMFAESNGIVTEAGQYRLFNTTAVSDVIISRQNIVFTLYDDEYLANGRFFWQIGGVNIAEIALDGSSIFENADSGNVVFVTSKLEHDKVVVVLTTKEQAPIEDTIYELVDPVEEGEYPVFEEGDRPFAVGKYTVESSVSLEGNELQTRFTDFELVKKKPEAEGGALALVEKVPGSLNFKQISVLPKSGSEHTLPDPGFNVKATGQSDPFDWEGWVYQVIRGGVLVTIDLSKYTGQPQFINYANPITESSLLVFGTFSSLDIDSIHEEDTTHRVIVTRRLGGAGGEISAILQADFSFGTFQDPDEVPDEDEVDDIVDTVARDAMSSEVIDYIKYLDVRVDNETIEIEEPENEAKNWLRIKEHGVDLTHIRQIAGKRVLGNMGSGIGDVVEVPVKTLLADVEPGDLVTIDVIEELVEEALEAGINGTPNFIPIYTTVHTIGDSIMRQSLGRIGFGIAPTEVIHAAGNILATGQLKSTIATGTAPLTVLSTTLVTNLNVDFLDGEHGEYYLDWNNFTNYKSVIAGVGLTGGGILSADRTLNFDTTWGDLRYALSSRQLIAGDGLTGGGNLVSDRTFHLGTPSTISNLTTNSVGADTHSHAIETASLIAGSNVTFSTSGANTILGTSDITISVNSTPWTIITGKPTTLGGYGITDAVDFNAFTISLGGKENVFGKGDIIQGSGIAITGGSLVDRLVGPDDITFSLTQTGVVPGTYRSVSVDLYGRVTGGSNPNSLAGYGITDAYTRSDVDGFLAGKSNNGHTHNSSQITDFTSAARGTISGSGGISYNSSTGVISYSGSSGIGGAGGGLYGRLAVWDGTSSIKASAILNDNDTQLTVNGHLVINSGSDNVFVLPSHGAHPTGTTSEGAMYYNTGGDRVYVLTGTGWRYFAYGP
jgi:hypothetical protein